MSGVTVGSRLEQLLELQRQVAINIELERRATGTRPIRPTYAPGSVPAAPATPAHERPASCLVRVPLSLVAPKVVRDWANAHGMKQGARGPVDDQAMHAFVEAHS